MAGRDDRALVRRIQAGDEQAFEELMNLFETRVYRLALRYTNNTADAEDVTQQVFIGVFRSMPKFRGDSALGTWVYRIAMNHCLEFRRRRRLDTVPLNEDLNLAVSDWREDPVQVAERADVARLVDASLERLSPAHRTVVVLHELHGLTYQEVASVLGIPVGTVKSRLSTAFQRLRPLLHEAARESTVPR